jgi:hypothetical protein
VFRVAEQIARERRLSRFAFVASKPTCGEPSKPGAAAKRPPGQGVTLRYRYDNGQLVKTTKTDGTTVPTDAFGIPL